MNGPIEQRYYDLRQASVYLGLSPKTLYKWAESGTMPAYKVGRVWRFDRDELDEFVHRPKTTICYNSDPSRDAVGFERKGV